MLIAAMPEFYVDVARVGNQVLAMVLYSLFTLIVMKVIEGRTTYLPVAAFVLGILLLTKAYALAAVPVLAGVAIYSMRGTKVVSWAALRVTLSFALTPLIASWWFLRNFRMANAIIWVGGAPAKNTGVIGIIESIPRVDWGAAASSLFASHVWWENWSFLSVRGWMYQVFEVAALLVVSGLFLQMVRTFRGRKDQDVSLRHPHLVGLFALYFSFMAALAYHALVTFIDSGVGASAGWYLYAVIVPEAMLVVVGLAAFHWGRYVFVGLVAAFFLLEIYATHWILIPYYAGLIAHTAHGTLQAFGSSRLGAISWAEFLTRLEINRPGFVTNVSLLVLWVLYLASSATLVFIAQRARSLQDKN